MTLYIQQNVVSVITIPGGDYNKFDTREEAESQIPDLVKNFGDCTADDFRVEEI